MSSEFEKLETEDPPPKPSSEYSSSSKKEQETEEEDVKEKPDAAVDELAQAVGKIHVRDDDAWKEAPEVLRKVATWIQNGTCRRILALSGAGVSVAAGIPDFRTPGTGLYDNLQKYNLPYPEAVFDLNFYRRNPGPFVSLAKEIWPGFKHVPTYTHSFLALLAEKDLLLRNYSQNIDGLEYLAEIPDDKLVECHGHFRTASCIKCGKAADPEVVKETIVVEGKAPTCSSCKAYVKPDIVFFGEGLPNRFHSLLPQDRRTADCCLILGTSLQVAPVSMIPDMVQGNCKRILFNREHVGNLNMRNKDRDVFHGGNCDDTIQMLARLLGWQDELEVKHAQARASILPDGTTKEKECVE